MIERDDFVIIYRCNFEIKYRFHTFYQGKLPVTVVTQSHGSLVKHKTAELPR